MSLDAEIVEDPLATILKKYHLNKEQEKAFILMCDHRRRNQPENANKPSQMLLYLTGAGGTGTSTVINAICDYFELTGQRDRLLVLDYTGIAASNISGSTIHSVCGFGFDKVGNAKESATGRTLR